MNLVERPMNMGRHIGMNEHLSIHLVSGVPLPGAENRT